MSPQLAIALIGYTLAFASVSVYAVSILRGNSKPHIFTRLVFCLLEAIVFLGQLVSGGGPGAWVTGLSALFSLLLVVLCFGYGTRDITRSDRALFVAALAAIVVWILTNEPLWSVLLAACIDIVAIIPTYRKTWKDPSSESLSAWNLGSLKYLASLGALSSFSLVTVIYPVEVILTNSILVAIVLYRKRPR